MNSWIEIRPVAEDLSRAEQTAAWQALVRERLARELGMTTSGKATSGKAGEQARDIEIRYAENGAPEVFVGAGVRNDPNRELSTNRAASSPARMSEVRMKVKRACENQADRQPDAAPQRRAEVLRSLQSPRRLPLSPGAGVVETVASDEAVVGDKLGHLSVSHTRGWVAVVWHPTAPCAVDIELRSRALPESVARRYGLSSMEDWCAREALWKYAGATGRRPELSDAGKALDPKTVRFLPHPDLIVAVITK